jgi:predicted ribosomally synthesized peptide with nif11-like leader
MSKEQFKAFQEATQKDAGLQEKLRSASGADDVVAIARAAGFLISAEELHRAQAELSDEELAGLSGGGDFVINVGGHLHVTNWNKFIKDSKKLGGDSSTITYEGNVNA